MPARLSKVILLILVNFLVACSVIKATDGPSRKDLDVLKIGKDRYAVIAELGEPVLSEKNNEGILVDVFSFEQGNHALLKGLKALGYGALAVGTIGVSELVINPVEGTLGQGAKIQVAVKYNANNKVTEVTVIKDERLIGQKIHQ